MCRVIAKRQLLHMRGANWDLGKTAHLCSLTRTFAVRPGKQWANWKLQSKNESCGVTNRLGIMQWKIDNASKWSFSCTENQMRLLSIIFMASQHIFEWHASFLYLRSTHRALSLSPAGHSHRWTALHVSPSIGQSALVSHSERYKYINAIFVYLFKPNVFFNLYHLEEYILH